MEILNINSYFFSSTVHMNLQKNLNRRDINAFTFAPVSKGYIPRIDYEKITDNNILKKECFNNKDRYFFHHKHVKILKTIENELEIRKFDLLHAHSLFSNGYIAMNLKNKYRIPYVVTVRDTDINIFFKRMLFLRKVGLNVLENADGIVFLSKSLKNKLINDYVTSEMKDSILSKSYVIPSGINEYWIKNINKIKLREKDNEIKLLQVGAINKRKNVMTTIKATEELIRKGYKIKLTLVGEVLNERIFHKFKDKNFITYHSPMTKEDLLQVYREHDIFIMPSITETFGLVYPEAMSQGLPVIYSKNQGFDKHFEDGQVGYSVNALDKFEIADKILKIVKNYEIIANSTIQSVEKFNWSSLSEDYFELYDRIIKDNNI